MKPRLTLISPGSPLSLTKTNVKKLDSAVNKLGYSSDYGKFQMHQDRFLAGSDKERVAQIMNAFCDKKTDVIMAIRGGWGCARILDKLNWETIKKHPKPLVGFSDVTTLQNAMIVKAGLASITGFVAKFWLNKTGSLTQESLAHVLAGEGVILEGLTGMTHGKATGKIIGGCLSSFEGLIGTSYMPKPQGKILLLEEVGEEPYVVDRMLTHLRNAGIFDAVNGIVLGEFYQCVPAVHNKADGTINQVLQEQFGKLKIPVVCGVPYTHAPNGVVLPFGTKTLVDADKGIIRIDGLIKK